MFVCLFSSCGTCCKSCSSSWHTSLPGRLPGGHRSMCLLSSLQYLISFIFFFILEFLFMYIIYLQCLNKVWSFQVTCIFKCANVYSTSTEIWLSLFLDYVGSEMGKLNSNASCFIYAFPLLTQSHICSPQHWVLMHLERSSLADIVPPGFMYTGASFVKCWVYCWLSSKILLTFSVASNYYLTYKFMSVSQFLLQLTWFFFMFQKQVYFNISKYTFHCGAEKHLSFWHFHSVL